MTTLKAALGSRYLREPVIIVLAYIPYFFARAHVVANPRKAYENAWDLVSFERGLGIFREVSVQSMAFSADILIQIFNVIYFYGHWPVIFVAGTWLFIKHPRTYTITRNAFLISGGLALILYAFFPVAPPRLIGGFADTLHLTVPLSYDKSRVVNPFAALPSLHVGWNVLIATSLYVTFRHPLARFGALLLPPLMLLATVATGNHFFIDGIAGALLALAAFLIARWLYFNWPAFQDRLVARLLKVRNAVWSYP
jgi:membrane-associated phospholipid phosphatase